MKGRRLDLNRGPPQRRRSLCDCVVRVRDDSSKIAGRDVAKHDVNKTFVHFLVREVSYKHSGQLFNNNDDHAKSFCRFGLQNKSVRKARGMRWFLLQDTFCV